MYDHGVLSFEEEDWGFRAGCFDGDGCGEQVPLVSEALDLGRGGDFEEFLSAPLCDALGMARRHGVRPGTLFRSVGMGVCHQVRALRYRSVVVALLSQGWRALRACLRHGYTAEYLFRDPVFPSVSHQAVLQDVALRLGREGVPWGRAAARRRLTEFFHGDYLVLVGHVLTESADADLQLHLFDLLGPRQFVSEAGRCSLLLAFWRRRRERFDWACDAIGVSRKNALLEVYASGEKGVLEDVLALGSPLHAQWAFAHAWNAGDQADAVRIAAVVECPGALPPPTALALEVCRRLARMERLVTSLLLEVARTPD